MGVALTHAPGQDELARLYYELAQVGATSVGERKDWSYQPGDKEELIVLASQMMRYDARLLSIMVQWFARHYDQLNPLHLRRLLRTARWPQSLLVAIEFARVSSADPELTAFAKYVSSGFERVDPAERFFLDSEQPGSRRATRNLGRNLAPYARWGFVGQERPTIDAVSKRAVGRYDADTRRRILEALAERHEDFSIADYLSAVDAGISRQQALADLRAYGGIKRVGKGRGARWQRRATRAANTYSPRKPVATTKIS